MQISLPNEHGCLEAGHTETVAQDGYSCAKVTLALAEDGRYRFAVSLSYSYGGFVAPICADGDGFANLQAAIDAGIAELLRRWPKPFACDPRSVFAELQRMRGQIEARLRQPSLF